MNDQAVVYGTDGGASSDNHEELLLTPEQRFGARRRDAMYISKTLVQSPAWWTLTETAMKVYMVFLLKRQLEEVKSPGKPGRRQKGWVVKNNGEITFTYAEAEKHYGITPGRFRRAIDQLVEVGFIDITYSGFGLQKDVTRYSISTRWKLYGTAEFVGSRRPRRDIHLGFKKGNRYGVRSKK